MYLFLTATTPVSHIKLHCHNFASIPNSICLLPHFTIHCTWLASFPYLQLLDFLKRCIPEELFSQWLLHPSQSQSPNSHFSTGLFPWTVDCTDWYLPATIPFLSGWYPAIYTCLSPLFPYSWGSMPLPPHMFSSASLVMVSSDAMKFVCCSGMEHMSTSHPFAPQALGGQELHHEPKCTNAFLLFFGCLIRRGLNPASHQFLKWWLNSVAWNFLSLFEQCFSQCIQLCKNVHQEKQVWKMFLSPGGPGILFFLLTPEGSSYLCAWCVSCIVHSKFDGLFVDHPEWSFPLISFICLCQGKVTGEFWVPCSFMLSPPTNLCLWYTTFFAMSTSYCMCVHWIFPDYLFPWVHLPPGHGFQMLVSHSPLQSPPSIVQGALPLLCVLFPSPFSDVHSIPSTFCVPGLHQVLHLPPLDQ